MSLSAVLWADSADQAAAARAHPFVRGLADGSLSLQVCQGYVAQDAVFLEAFARAYALGLARSRDLPTLEAFADLVAGVLVELRLHAAYAERWETAAAAEPLPATLAYRGLLQRLGTAPYADALGCLHVVERVYLEAWRSALPGAPAYAELVEHWTTPGFAAYVDGLGAASDRAGAPDGALVAEVLRLEAAFWAMAGAA